jgi:hypothetical protein
MITNHKFSRVCAECGAAFGAQRAHAKYCTTECRKAFHNRAMMRGKEVYHFLMIKQYDRHTGGKGVGEKLARQVLGALVQGYREADARNRDGRPSWLALQDALDELGRLPAVCDNR